MSPCKTGHDIFSFQMYSGCTTKNQVQEINNNKEHIRNLTFR